MYFRMPNLSKWPCHWLAQMLKFNLLTSEIHWVEQSFGESSAVSSRSPIWNPEWLLTLILCRHTGENFDFILRVFILHVILTLWIPSTSLMTYDTLHSCMVSGVHTLFLESGFRSKESSFMSYTSITKVWALDIEDNHSCFTSWLSCDSSPACCSLYLLLVWCELCPSVQGIA